MKTSFKKLINPCSNIQGERTMHFTIGHIVLLHWIQTKVLENQKLLSIGVKRIFWAYNLLRKGDRCLLFLKTFSGDSDLLNNARWFCCEDAQLGSEICILLKINLIETKFAVRRITTINYMSSICEIESSDSNLIKKIFEKYRFFKKLPHIFTKFCRPTASTL